MRLSPYRVASFLFLAVVVFLMGVSAASADTKLEESMKQLGGAYKELSNDLKQPQDADKDHYLVLATTMKTQALASHDLVPKLAQTLPDDQRSAMVQSFQKDMDKFAADIDSLSDALKNSQWDNARKVMGTLHEDMVGGHKEFRAQDHKPHNQPQPEAAAPTPNPSPAPVPSGQ